MRLLLFLIILFALPAYSQTGPVPQQAGFPISPPTGGFANLLVADIDNDGFQDILSFAGSAIYAYNHEGVIKNGWPFVSNLVTSGPLILIAGDMDGDGDLEITWTSEGDFLVIDHLGVQIPDTVPAELISDTTSRPILFCDVNGDGKEELIAGRGISTEFNTVELHCIDQLGDNLPGWPIQVDLSVWSNSYANKISISHVCAGDFNYDNSYEILFGTTRTNLTPLDPGPVYKFLQDGTAAPGYPLYLGLAFYSAQQVIADFNLSGQCQYGGVGLQAFSVYHSNAGYYFQFGLPGAHAGLSAVAPGNFDADDHLGMLFNTDFGLTIGKPMPGLFQNWVLANNPAVNMSNPCVADIDGDGISEIAGLISGTPQTFGVLNAQLNFLPGWPAILPIQHPAINELTYAADLDADGDIEFILSTPESIFAFDMPGTAGKIHWACAYGNHAGNYFVDYRNYPNVEFIRGDINSDSLVDISDVILSLENLFFQELDTLCKPRLDVDANEVVNLADPILLLNYLFVGNHSIPAPFPNCEKMPSAAYRKIYCLQTECN